MAGIGGVVVQFRADADKAIRETKKFVKSLNGVDGASRSAGSALKKGLAAGALGAGAAIAGAGAALIKFGEQAIADDAAQKRLAKTIKNTTKATDKQTAAVEDWITQQGIAMGVADDQLRPALSRLVRATKDVGKAQKLATLAMDISAATGKDYNTVAVGLAKATDGQVLALRKLGITLGDSALNAQEYNRVQDQLVLAQIAAADSLSMFGPKSKEYTSAMKKVTDLQDKSNALAAAGIDWQKELTKEFAGQGKEQANTIEGTWARIKLILSEGTESLGAVVLAPLERFADWLADPKHVTEVKDFLNKIGEEAYAAGESFVAWVDNTLAPAIQKVYDYFASAEGQAQIKSWGDAFLATADAVGALISKLDTLFKLVDKLPSNFILQKLGLIPKLSDLTSGGAGQPTVTRDQVRAGALATAKKDRATKNWQNEPRGVTVIINNPKAEKALDSAALALRLERNLR